MATATKTLRLRDNLRSEIDRIARRSRRSFSEVTQDLIEEALRMRKCPGIYFAEEPGGREAKIALLYYRDYAEEIDALVAENEEASLEVPEVGLPRQGSRQGSRA